MCTAMFSGTTLHNDAIFTMSEEESGDSGQTKRRRVYEQREA